MQRAVVAIGIKKTGGLPELQAVHESAQAVSDWARTSQKIPANRVKLITDAKGVVGRDRIFESISKIADLGFIEQLIVYFSGHGINSGLHEQWLLSRAPDDPAAAVNLRGSELLARFCGIGHVVFISDACRTAADSIQAQGVTGGEIFPNVKARGVEHPVDQYFATLVGNPAYEVKTVEDAVSRYRAAYSKVLLDALNGKTASLMENGTNQRVIRPWPLKRHLATAVPDYIASLGLPGGETQQPDARIESEPETWLAEFPAAAVASDASPASGLKRARGRAVRSTSKASLTGDEDLPAPGLISAAHRPTDLVSEAGIDLLATLDPSGTANRKRAAPVSSRNRAPGAARRELDRARASAASSFGPDRFETRCGIKLRGARVAESLARRGSVAVDSRRESIGLSLETGRHGTNVLIKLLDGSSVVVPAFRDCITGLSFDADGSLDGVSIEPSVNSERRAGWRAASADFDRLRIQMAASSSLGVLRLGGTMFSEGMIGQACKAAALDPALAAATAYALHDHRLRPRIVAMQQELDRDLHARVFDVAMLAFSMGRKPGPGEPREFYPCVPMLAQGWALLEPLEIKLPGGLNTLRGQLRPTVWTHFMPSAVNVLMKAFTEGEVD